MLYTWRTASATAFVFVGPRETKEPIISRGFLLESGANRCSIVSLAALEVSTAPEKDFFFLKKKKLAAV